MLQLRSSVDKDVDDILTPMVNVPRASSANPMLTATCSMLLLQLRSSGDKHVDDIRTLMEEVDLHM
jgi:hypothetical protein